jgi:hypothetical protein
MFCFCHRVGYKQPLQKRSMTASTYYYLIKRRKYERISSRPISEVKFWKVLSEGGYGGPLIQEYFSRILQGVIIPHIIGLTAVAFDRLQTVRVVGIHIVVRGLVWTGFSA